MKAARARARFGAKGRKRWITPPSQDLLQGVQELHLDTVGHRAKKGSTAQPLLKLRMMKTRNRLVAGDDEWDDDDNEFGGDDDVGGVAVVVVTEGALEPIATVRSTHGHHDGDHGYHFNRNKDLMMGRTIMMANGGADDGDDEEDDDDDRRSTGD